LALSVPEVAGQESSAADKPIAPLLENLGALHHPITTTSDRAQRFFDQGLRLTYAFNHAEAVRSFKEAARLDPDCAMAYWGQALALGPNINDPMPPEREQQAYGAIQKALTLLARVTDTERAYIEALATRFSVAENRNRSLDAAYAAAMGQLHKRYPDDPDAGTLYAAAIMETMPWDYWQKNGQPKLDTVEALTTLESAIRSHPSHPGAHHFYIHAVEASSNPDRGIRSAERLESLMPGAGHLVHMPAHIYIRVGRYAEASEANVRAIAADEDYITQCRAQGIYPLAYYPHNIHFLWATSTMEGRSAVAIRAARQVASKIPQDKLQELPSWGRPFLVTPLYALTRFGKWDDILKEPRPAGHLPFPTGIWHYARGIALTAKGRLQEASEELGRLTVIAGDPSMAQREVGINSASSLLSIASEVLAGELAAKRGQMDKAVSHLEKAVGLEDELRYNEPPDWHYPVRQSLGAVLLRAGRAAEAEVVYREDLQKNRENGWSLYGLMKSLLAQKKSPEAAVVEKRFQKAWGRADVRLESSRF
jgi:tetratricopeptide (TPR) repeat protein